MFNGIQPRKYKEVLSCLNATVREYPRGAHIVELNDVVAEIALHRRRRVLALFECDHRIGEGLHEH